MAETRVLVLGSKQVGNSCGVEKKSGKKSTRLRAKQNKAKTRKTPNQQNYNNNKKKEKKKKQTRERDENRALLRKAGRRLKH